MSGSSSDAARTSISARGWTQYPDHDPGEGLITAALTSDGAAYDIQIRNELLEQFYKYWYVWLTPQGYDQDDILYTEIYGTFGMGEGDDTMSIAVQPPAQWPQFQQSFVLGGPGDDIISVANIIDNNALSAYGGSGNDSITGSWQNDLLYGDEADYFDLFPTTTGFTPIAYDTAGDGNDTISAFVGDDTIHGGGGDDVLSGGEGDDLITAASGSNQLFGGDGSDTITGGTGSDFLYGGPRGAGFLDILSGGGGADVFMLSYTEEATSGASFWTALFDKNLGTITGDGIQSTLADFFKGEAKDLATGFISAALGGIGDALVNDFFNWLANLGPVATPQEDILVIRDFDPSQDILVLPTAPGIDLSEPGAISFNPDAAGDYWKGLEFKDNSTGKLYAEVTLSTDFLASVGLTQADNDEIARILSFLTANPTHIDPTTAGFSSLSNLSAYVTDGGFTPPAGADLPSGVAVLMFGAIGGLVYHSEPGDYANSFIVGTQYSDVLTLNPVIDQPGALQNNAADVTTTQSEVHGLGGDDIIYGTVVSDVLRGGDGDDTIFSLLTDDTGEDIAGGAGNDVIFGGGSFGTFDGGDGTDTFGIFHGQLIAPMQAFIDLQTGQAGERAAPADTSAPVGSNPPFTPAPANHYTISGFENAIGGSLNDWIRMTAGGTAEGGAGADYIDGTAGGVVFSYAGSTAGVSVELYSTDAVTGGGDAEGDVLDYSGVGPAGVIGSGEADILGGVSTNGFAFTGGGGTDTFRILEVSPSATEIEYTVTDFSVDDGDIVDLRQIGATRAQVEIKEGHLLVVNPGGTEATIRITTSNYSGPILPANILVAEAVSGVGRAAPGGGALSGGAGDDVLRGQSGEDYLLGNAGDDVLAGFDGDDRLNGGSGRDLLRGGDGGDRLAGGSDADTILGQAGDDHVSAEDGDDHVHAGAGDDTVTGGAGSDTVIAAAGDDSVLGGGDADSMSGNGGNDTLLGEAADDTLTGSNGYDLLDGGAGDDSLDGGNGLDTLIGGDGQDMLVGGALADSLLGGAAEDTLDGGTGADLLDGGDGQDLLLGGLGRDVLRGGTGDDLLSGGEGRDLFVFGANTGNDTITDLTRLDTIRIEDGLKIADQILIDDGSTPDLLLVLSDGGTITLLDVQATGLLVFA